MWTKSWKKYINKYLYKINTKLSLELIIWWETNICRKVKMKKKLICRNVHTSLREIITTVFWIIRVNFFVIVSEWPRDGHILRQVLG